jgi:hypothetical protein
MRSAAAFPQARMGTGQDRSKDVAYVLVPMQLASDLGVECGVGVSGVHPFWDVTGSRNRHSTRWTPTTPTTMSEDDLEPLD